MIIIADENESSQRLDTFVSGVLQDISRSKIQGFIKNGSILVNSELKRPSYSLREGDRVEINLAEEKEIKIPAQDIKLDIVYEDENMLVVNKPSGMLTHPTTLEPENTLVNALLYKYGDNLSDINGEFRRGILHRLDRNTSGLLMVAKNNQAHEFLAEQIKNHTVTKKYLAVLKGNYPKDEEVIDLPIGRNPAQPHKMMVAEGGKESRTILRVLKRYNEATYVELTLVTGRTHQIRVHTSYKKFPVYNDTLYGAGKGKVNTEEQVLQSYYLKFAKPFSGEIIELQQNPMKRLKRFSIILKAGQNEKNIDTGIGIFNCTGGNLYCDIECWRVCHIAGLGTERG